MKLKDFITSNNLKLFQKIHTVQLTTLSKFDPFPFLETDKAVILDQALKLEYGNRTVFEPFEEMTENELAELIVTRFEDSWNNYMKSVDLSQDIDSFRTVEETIAGTTDKTGSGDTTNKVSGYNSTSMIDDSGVTNTNTEGVVNDQTKTIKESLSDLNNNYNLLSEVSKQQLQSKILQDVVNTLTLKVY